MGIIRPISPAMYPKVPKNNNMEYLESPRYTILGALLYIFLACQSSYIMYFFNIGFLSSSKSYRPYRLIINLLLDVVISQYRALVILFLRLGR